MLSFALPLAESHFGPEMVIIPHGKSSRMTV